MNRLYNVHRNFNEKSYNFRSTIQTSNGSIFTIYAAYLTGISIIYFKVRVLVRP